MALRAAGLRRRRMTSGGRARLGYFSLSAHAESGDDRPYLSWHQLDHMPEQYQLPGLVLGQRWAATEACRAARTATDDRWAGTEHVVCYLMGEPLDETVDGFLALGSRLARMGRFPLHLPSCYRGGLVLLEAHAAPRVLVGADVVPFRPHRGVYLVVEGSGDERWDAHHRQTGAESVRALLETEGVAGVWTFATSPEMRPGELQPRRPPDHPVLPRRRPGGGGRTSGRGAPAGLGRRPGTTDAGRPLRVDDALGLGAVRAGGGPLTAPPSPTGLRDGRSWPAVTLARIRPAKRPMRRDSGRTPAPRLGVGPRPRT